MVDFCREDRIRTCDPLVPNQVRYRPALLPDCMFCKGTIFLLQLISNLHPVVAAETANHSKHHFTHLLVSIVKMVEGF